MEAAWWGRIVWLHCDYFIAAMAIDYYEVFMMCIYCGMMDFFGMAGFKLHG